MSKQPTDTVLFCVKKTGPQKVKLLDEHSRPTGLLSGLTSAPAKHGVKNQLLTVVMGSGMVAGQLISTLNHKMF